MYIVQFTKYNNVQCTGCLNHVQLRCTLRDCKYNFKLTYIQNNSQPETPETRVIMQSLNKYNISNIFNNLCVKNCKTVSVSVYFNAFIFF